MKRKMYIFSDQYPWGKGEKPFIEPEIEALREFFDITIVSIASDADFRNKDLESDVDDEIEVIRWKRPSLLGFLLHATSFPFSKVAREEVRRIQADGFSMRRLLDSIRAYGISKALLSFYRRKGIFATEDAVYYSFWFSYQLLALAFEKETRNIDLISRIHGYDLFNGRNKNNRQPFQWFKKAMTNLIIFASSNAMDAFEAEFGPAGHSGQFLLNRLGVPKHRAPAALEESPKKLLVSCSNVIPLKHVGLVAESIAASPRKDEIQWVHFGDGPLLEEIRKEAQALNLNATFYGHTSNERIMEFYENKSVDALILLSETEGGCPVCFQEALSFGIPLIGTDVGGIPETVDGNGVLLPQMPSKEDVSQAIDAVCFASADVKKKMSERSIELWGQRFDIAANKEQLLSELRERTYLDAEHPSPHG